jgi:DNA-binding FadR family transcriptional regulator
VTKPLRTKARALLDRVRTEIAKDPADHTQDAETLLSVRDEIGELLAQLAAEDVRPKSPARKGKSK